MTEVHLRTSARYTVEESWDAAGPGQRCLATDGRLGRTVLLRTLAAPEDDPRRAQLLALVRRCTRLSHPAFLHVLDVVMQPEHLTVVLEASDGVRLRRGSSSQFPGLPGPLAAGVTLQVGEALQEAAHHSLSTAGPLPPFLYWDDDTARLDPIGLFGRTGEGAAPQEPQEPQELVALLCGLLASLVRDNLSPNPSPKQGGEQVSPFPRREGGQGVRSAAADALGPFLVRWQQPSAGPLPAFLADLRALAGALAERPRTVREAPVEVEATMPLPLGLAAAPPLRRTLFSTLAAVGLLAGIAALGAVGTDLASWVGATARPSPTSTAVPANRTTLSLTAQRATQVRVTVDGAPSFSGVLRAGESRSWAGERRVQVWTNGGKTLLVTVNGHPLGPLSAAVGHPEWNEVDWGWLAGWRP